MESIRWRPLWSTSLSLPYTEIYMYHTVHTDCIVPSYRVACSLAAEVHD